MYKTVQNYANNTKSTLSVYKNPIFGMFSLTLIHCYLKFIWKILRNESIFPCIVQQISGFPQQIMILESVAELCASWIYAMMVLAWGKPYSYPKKADQRIEYLEIPLILLPVSPTIFFGGLIYSICLAGDLWPLSPARALDTDVYQVQGVKHVCSSCVTIN